MPEFFSHLDQNSESTISIANVSDQMTSLPIEKCDDEGFTCHICHFGHCAFTLKPFSLIVSPADKEGFLLVYQLLNPLVFIESPNRPPIS